tara:strand:+ start:744 stop:1976 length:1233 start_codon:yes stop_codon:yes gene_type:complete
MAEEQSPSAQPTQKPQTYKPGDYYVTGGKTYVWGPRPVDINDPTWSAGSFGFVPQPLNFKPQGGRQIVQPPEGVVGIALGYDLDTQRENKAGDARARAGLINLKTLPSVARPAEGDGSYRYPMAGEDQGGITKDGDFVLFQFYDYKAPFGDRKPDGGVFDYNMANEYVSASGYKPIMLYMPEDVSTGFRANWDGKSMSTLATEGLRAMGRKGLGDKVASGATAINNLLDKVGPLAGAAALQAATSKLTGDSLSYDDIFGGISGAIFNPNTELLFGGIQMRNFSLNFKLVPRHQKESVEVNNLTEQFKKAMLPSKYPGKVLGFNQDGNNQGVKLGFIGVPKLVRVSFMKGSNENPRMPRYKMCALTSVDVNYTPDGTYATYSDGQPVAVGLQLNFQETKICFAEDVGKSVR